MASIVASGTVLGAGVRGSRGWGQHWYVWRGCLIEGSNLGTLIIYAHDIIIITGVINRALVAWKVIFVDSFRLRTSVGFGT